MSNKPRPGLSRQLRRARNQRLQQQQERRRLVQQAQQEITAAPFPIINFKALALRVLRAVRSIVGKGGWG